MEPFEFGTVLKVRLAFGRIERTTFVVHFAQDVHGGGYRYIGVFPGNPPWRGKIYSEDVVKRLKES